MMDSTILPLDIPRVDGPDGLYQYLCEYLEHIKKDAALGMTEHYVLYQMGRQQSLIKIDMSEHPFQFWYCDLFGRPATNMVKDTIARFLWEKGGEKERYLAKGIRG